MIQSRDYAERIWFDGHVHVHRCFDVKRLLDCATANFAAASGSPDRRGAGPGVLLFTESAGDHFYHRFREQTEQDPLGPWSFRRTGDPISLTALRGKEPRLILVAGRQVATAENLEVLALGCDEEFPDGRSLHETLEAVRRSGGLPVVPWGFGKWWFRRGRLVKGLVQNEDPADFFLGDNGGRLRFGPRPTLFSKAEARGIRILPGSDPLPFPHHATRVGSFGFWLAGPLDSECPGQSILEALRRRETVVEPYGRGERLLPFVRNQLAMQMRKRQQRGPR